MQPEASVMLRSVGAETHPGFEGRDRDGARALIATEAAQPDIVEVVPDFHIVTSTTLTPLQGEVSKRQSQVL